MCLLDLLCCFRARGSTLDLIFSLRWMQEGCGEQSLPLCIVSIDFTGALCIVGDGGGGGLLKVPMGVNCHLKLLCGLMEPFITT